MELVKGGTLKNLIDKRKSFIDEEASVIIRSILRAVEHVHSKSFVHRDLKPENILIDDVSRLETIKLADFGLSATFKLNPHFQLNEKMGTLLFMAPEQTNHTAYGKV